MSHLAQGLPASAKDLPDSLKVVPVFQTHTGQGPVKSLAGQLLGTFALQVMDGNPRRKIFRGSLDAPLGVPVPFFVFTLGLFIGAENLEIHLGFGAGVEG